MLFSRAEGRLPGRGGGLRNSVTDKRGRESQVPGPRELQAWEG